MSDKAYWCSLAGCELSDPEWSILREGDAVRAWACGGDHLHELLIALMVGRPDDQRFIVTMAASA